MHDVADALDELPDAALLVRVLELSGFGSRHAGEAVAVDPQGRPVAGGVLTGLTDAAVARHVRDGMTVGVIEAEVSDPDAAAAGMACGGRARLLLQPAATVPSAGWDALRARRPVVVATQIVSGATRVIVDGDAADGSVGDGAVDATVDAAAHRLLRAGRTASELGNEVLLEAFLPPTTVRIVGRAGVGDALAAQARLLGWHHETIDAVEDAVAAAEAQASHDALVVLSHDPAVDTPCLAAALAHGRGYVGALGSRGTQAARRQRLAERGCSADELATIHGPVGLDLGSRTPAETAVAIVAEIIAHRAGRSAASLAAHDGPING